MRISRRSTPSSRAALSTSGSSMATICAPPGARWADRGGVFVRTGTHRGTACSRADRRRWRQLGRCPEVTGTGIRPTVLNQVEVERGHATVCPEADLRPALESRPRPPDVVLLVAGDAKHDRTADLARQHSRYRHDRRTRNLAAEAAAAVFADEHHVLGLDTGHARHAAAGALGALGRSVQEQLPVLPVRHAGARLHRVVGDRLVDDRLLDDDIRLGEARLDVADGPLRRGLTHRQPVRSRLLENGCGPLQAPQFAPSGHVSAHMCIRPALTQAIERVQHEGKRLQIHPDRLDGRRRGRFVDRRHRQDRFTLVLRLVGQRAFARAFRLHRQLVGPQDSPAPPPFAPLRSYPR